VKQSPAIPYDSMRANAQARKLNAAAFVRIARNAARAHRCQVLLQGDGVAYLVASGPTWVDALAQYFTWHMEHSNGEAQAAE
jgi:hypothetical protein